MLKTFIRLFFILITAIYSFYKLSNSKPKNKAIQIKVLTFSISISGVIALLFNSNKSLGLIILFILFFLIMKIFEKQNTIQTYVNALFSFAFSFIVFSFSIIIISLLFLPFHCEIHQLPWHIIHTLIGITQFSIIYFCFHVPRLQKGMLFLHYLPSGNIGFTLSITIVMLIIMANQIETKTDSLFLSLFSFILISAFLLIYWWNYHITQTYRKFLRRNELDSLNLLLEERNQQIIYLKNENDKLARIIHKDNKIIPALSMTIIDSHENKTELDLSKLESDSSLYTKLKQLYAERTETLEKYQREILRLPQTSFDSINAVLSFMQSESLNAGIPYEVVLLDNLDSTIPAEITENDFTHILSDLLVNAVNACRDVPSASIQVYLGKMKYISTIKICNTGNIFNIETLKNLGLVRHTTHANTGGSGIGLMDIWKIKEKYKATLLIDEIADASLSEIYTHVNLLFNHKNHYIIQSDRHKELSAYINRPDIMILSKD